MYPFKNHIIAVVYLGLIAAMLAGCSFTVDLQPPWQHGAIRLHPHHDAEMPPTPPATATPDAGAVTSTLSSAHPVQIFDLRPLTATASYSLTTLVPIESIRYANGCNVNQALNRAPLPYVNGTVLAALTYISGTVPLDGSAADNRGALAPSLGRTLYWSSETGPSAPVCPPPETWLWQQIVLLPEQANPDAYTPRILVLPATAACEIGPGFSPITFGSLAAERGEWPQLLYLVDEDGKPGLLLLQQDVCGSGSDCTSVRTICQSLFEDGEWRRWCQSLCS